MSELKYKALALDLDGTLTDSNKNVPQANKEAIWKAIDQDVTIILASGRATMGITGIAKELELDKRGGIIVAFTAGKLPTARLGKSFPIMSCQKRISLIFAPSVQNMVLRRFATTTHKL